ncbi:MULTISPECIES: hypothetical protein [Bacillus]|uniref:hypothetical protein n=1 Tax=Bacillus TaxID=1386 RepID=UPI002115A749|nr:MULTISPECIES: hypothetical protein [Bacillus]
MEWLDLFLPFTNHPQINVIVQRFNEKEALLPDLQRKNKFSAMFYAVIYASCDSICEGKWSRSLEEMEKSVYRILKYRYAAPLDSPYLLKIVPEVVKGLKNLKESHANFIKGSKFLPKEKI